MCKIFSMNVTNVILNLQTIIHPPDSPTNRSQIVGKGKCHLYFSTSNVHKRTWYSVKRDKSDENGINCINCRKCNCGVYEHMPNLCVAHEICGLCLDKDITDTRVCDFCCENERIFTNPSTTDDFCRWIFSEVNTGCTPICHNLKAYDSYPIQSTYIKTPFYLRLFRQGRNSCLLMYINANE